MYDEATRLESSINHLKHSLARSPSALLASRPSAEYFIFHIALAAML